MLRVGPLVVDPAARDVRLHGSRIDLTAKEYALLRHLATNPTKVFAKDELKRAVWGPAAVGASSRTLDSHAARLRAKLTVRGDRLVVNVWGVGYRLADAAAGDEAQLG